MCFLQEKMYGPNPYPFQNWSHILLQRERNMVHCGSLSSYFILRIFCQLTKTRVIFIFQTFNDKLSRTSPEFLNVYENILNSVHYLHKIMRRTVIQYFDSDVIFRKVSVRSGLRYISRLFPSLILKNSRVTKIYVKWQKKLVIF